MARACVVPTTLVGTGRLARSFVPLMDRSSYRVATVVGRRLSAAKSAAKAARRATATTDLRTGAERARLILLAVPDREIAGVARRLAALADVDWKKRTVLHHAGALGCAPLAPLRRAGAGVAVLHPLQSLGIPALAAEVLPGSRARIEGDRRGRSAARRLARELGLVPLELGDLTTRQRTAYHAAASLASNDVLALLSIGVELLGSLGLGPRRALTTLLPLVRGTLRQVEHSGLGGPLTGPAPRGDVATLRAHLERLGAASSEPREIHRLLSVRLARLALDRGETAAAETLDALGGSRRRRGV